MPNLSTKIKAILYTVSSIIIGILAITSFVLLCVYTDVLIVFGLIFLIIILILIWQEIYEYWEEKFENEQRYK